MSATTEIYRNPAGEAELMSFYDQALAAWPVPFIRYEVETRHGRTSVIECGHERGPVLMLIHGAASNALSWMGDVPVYAPHFRLLVPDVPGEPGKSANHRPDHQGQDFSDWLEDVLAGALDRSASGSVNGRTEAGSGVSLLGISKGGFIALKFATAHPEKVEKLVLLTPGGIAPARWSFMLRVLPLSMLGASGRRRIGSITLGNDEIHPGAVEFMDVIMKNYRPEIPKPYIFSDDELRRLSMPTLLVAGMKDALLNTQKMVARSERVIPGAICVRLPDRGHALVGLANEVLPFLLGEEAADAFIV